MWHSKSSRSSCNTLSQSIPTMFKKHVTILLAYGFQNGIQAVCLVFNLGLPFQTENMSSPGSFNLGTIFIPDFHDYITLIFTSRNFPLIDSSSLLLREKTFQAFLKYLTIGFESVYWACTCDVCVSQWNQLRRVPNLRLAYLARTWIVRTNEQGRPTAYFSHLRQEGEICDRYQELSSGINRNFNAYYWKKCVNMWWEILGITPYDSQFWVRQFEWVFNWWR